MKCPPRTFFFGKKGLSRSSFQVSVDACRRFFARTHCGNDGRRTGHDVAARKDVFFGALKRVVDDDGAFPSLFKIGRFFENERVRGCADGNDDDIGVDRKVRTVNGHRTSAAGSVGFSEFHFDAFDRDDVEPADFFVAEVAVDANGVCEEPRRYFTSGVFRLTFAGMHAAEE